MVEHPAEVNGGPWSCLSLVRRGKVLRKNLACRCTPKGFVQSMGGLIESIESNGSDTMRAVVCNEAV
jgi:hypothetical protein